MEVAYFLVKGSGRRGAVNCGRSAILLLLALACAGLPVEAAHSKANLKAQVRHRARSTTGSQLKAQKPQLDHYQAAPEPAPAPATSCCQAQSTQQTNAGAGLAEILRYGTRKHAQGNLAEAEAAFKHVLSRDPQNVDAFFDLGALAEQRGDLFTALSDYRAALALHPGDAQINEAVASVEAAIKQGPAFAFDRPRSVLPATSDSMLPTEPYQQDGVFQLSSSRADLLAGASGNAPASLNVPVVPSPVVPVSTPPVAGAAAGPSPFRSAANGILNTGLNLGLRAAGLHCPVCHMVRFHF